MDYLTWIGLFLVVVGISLFLARLLAWGIGDESEDFLED